MSKLYTLEESDMIERMTVVPVTIPASRGQLDSLSRAADKLVSMNRHSPAFLDDQTLHDVLAIVQSLSTGYIRQIVHQEIKERDTPAFHAGFTC